MKTVKLVSGGIDSYIMSQQYEGINLYIDFGQKYAAYEKYALKKLGVDFKEIKIDSEVKFDSGDIYISDRNLTLCCIASMLYEPDLILLAGLKDDNCKDKTEEAFKEMSDIISKFAKKEVKVMSPYFDITKGQLIQSFTDKEKLKDTFSCYYPKANGEQCGNCPACLRKKIALETNGVKCDYELSNEIVDEYLKKIHIYEPDRVNRFYEWYLKKYNISITEIDGGERIEYGIHQVKK